MAVFSQIKASAGSGKTYTLTREYLARVLSLGRRKGRASGSCATRITAYSAAEILAITFTNAAASEMRERAILRLKKAALSMDEHDSDITPEEARKWLDELLRDMGSLNIRTIDSLLLLIVRASALSLGLSPDFTTELASAEALDPWLEKFLERARVDEPSRALLRSACAALVDPAKHSLAYGRNIGDTLSQMLNNALLEKFADIAPEDKIASLLAKMEKETRDAARDLLDECLAAKNLTMNKNAGKKLELFAQGNFPNDFGAYLLRENAAGLFNKKPDIPDAIIRKWSNFMESAGQLLDNLPALKAGMKLLPFIRVAGVIADEFRKNMSAEGILPASLIPAYAGKALRSGFGVSDALCRLGNRLTHFLVDEFQDTSREQWNVLQPLALDALSRGGSLTYVGDVKQSIYGWRQADPRLFGEVLSDRELLSVSGKPEVNILKTNWRSSKAIVDHNNLLFSRLEDVDFARGILDKILPKSDFPEDIKQEGAKRLASVFADAKQNCAKEENSGYIRAESIIGHADELDGLVQQNLCALVHSIHERRPWSDIVILVRNNNMGTLATEALVAADVPVITENSLSLAKHPLIIQSVAFLSFLDNQRNDVAFWTLISGSIFLDSLYNRDLTEDILLDWAAQRTGKPLAFQFAEHFSDTWQKLLLPFANQASLMTPYDIIMEWYAFLDVEKRFAEDKTFLRRFMEVLHQAEEKGFASISAFLEFWSEKGNQEKTPMPENMDAARVMTIHKAKGLEAPVAIVPWTNFSIKPSDEYIAINRCGLVIPACLKRKATGREYYEDYARQAMEAINLLYVALTRPREELYFFREMKDSDRSPVMGLGKGLDELVHASQLDYPYEFGTLPPVVETGNSPPAPNEREVQRQESEETLPVYDEDKQKIDMDPPDWRPMQWLPDMKIFRNKLDRELLTPAQRGIFAHACLERLQFRDTPEQDARNALNFTLRCGDMKIPETDAEKESIFSGLVWFATLPGAKDWLTRGKPEQSMVNAAGELLRADLIVPGKQGSLIIDYKTGHPDEKNVSQLRDYLKILIGSGEASDKVQGLLLYLDIQKFQIVTEEGCSELLTDIKILENI